MGFPAQETGVKPELCLIATHVLVRDRVPEPQVLLQTLQELHRDHLDSEK